MNQDKLCNVKFDIHSFIHYGDLYSAPSMLLLRSAPDPCTAKDKSFEARVKCVRKNPGEQSLRKESPFHTKGPTTENARAWVVDVRAKGTKSNLCSDERSKLRPLVPGVGQQGSRRSAGARPRIHLQTMAPIRNMIRCWRGSQWSIIRLIM